jgi:hypothetical protein
VPSFQNDAIKTLALDHDVEIIVRKKPASRRSVKILVTAA